MGNHIDKPSNKSMVDRLVQSHIRTPIVEGAFRAVDRAMYFELEEDESTDPYGDEPWRRGNIHLSAPCIYANVVEALDLRTGLSFLNLGSGTGYLNTIIGLLVGPNGINHGIEFHSDVVDYAYKRLQKFKEQSYAIDKFDFSEPVFIKGNCINLNPISRYDRIYLGAACLPDLEAFMKKLIKPDGGILVMPCGQHLMRYIRVSDNEWKSEKLMDVSFTSMIRQGDDETIIDMPLSQAKTLKELCRIVIRKQLRDKIDIMNPNLLHSDNMYVRQKREKEEREYLRNKRRFKAELDKIDTNITLSKLRVDATEKKRSEMQSSRNERKLSSRKRDKMCICRSRRDASSQTSESVNKPKRSSPLLKPGKSNGSGGVLTRSASRKLEGRKVSRSSDKFKLASSSSSNSNLNEEFNEFDGRISTSSIYDSSDGGEVANLSNQGNIRDGSSSRTRPFVYSVRRRNPFSFTTIAQEFGPRMLSPPALLPAQRRIARLIEPLSSDSSSSSPSPDLRTTEYDYIRKQVVRRLPSILAGMHNDDLSSIDSPGGSHLSDLLSDEDTTSEEESWDELSESCSNGDATSETSWNILEGVGGEYCYNKTDDELSTASSCFGTPDILSDFLDRSNDEEEEDCSDFEANDDESSGCGEPQPSTSRVDRTTPFAKAGQTNRKHWRTTGVRENWVCKPISDQEPVASRLRSKQHHGASTSAASTSKQPPPLAQPLAPPPPPPPPSIPVSDSNQSRPSSSASVNRQAQPMDRPVPSCSRNETNWSLSRQGRKQRASRCPIHRRRSHDKLSSRIRNQNRSHNSKHNKTSQTVPSNPASPTSSSNANTSSTHSSMQLSSEAAAPSGSHRGGQTSSTGVQRGLFTGRLLYTTRLGTTISLAARHYSSWHSSFRLFERRSLGSGSASLGASNRSSGPLQVAAGRHSHQHPQQQQQQQQHQRQSDRKRKRPASSDSSDFASADSSPTRSGRSSARARHCDCSHQSSQVHDDCSRGAAGSGASQRSRELVCGGCDDEEMQPDSSSMVNNNGTAKLAGKRDPAALQTEPAASSVGRRSGASSQSGSAYFAADCSTSGGDNRPISANQRGARKQLSTRSRAANPVSSGSGHQQLQQRTTRSDYPQNHHQLRDRSAPLGRRPKEIESHRSSNRQTASARQRRQRRPSDESVHIRQRRHQWRPEKSQRRRRKRNANECERYHNHMSGYIRQLPLPRVLHSYLNYERASL